MKSGIIKIEEIFKLFEYYVYIVFKNLIIGLIIFLF